MLSLLIRKLSDVYKTDPFQAREEAPSVTLAQLERACSWSDLVATYDLPEDANPLTLGNLRFSRLFPQMFVYRSGGGTTVLTLEESAAIVRSRAQQYPRGSVQSTDPD